VSTGLTEATELLPRLQQVLPSSLARALTVVVETAEGQGRTLYLVGGCVRDLALGRDLVDVDVAGEGEMGPLGATAASALGGRCVAHRGFGTVTLEANGARVDLAMARAETYARPGALPQVRPASIREDLARRDFTINALALAICGPERGCLLDPFGGSGTVGAVAVKWQRNAVLIDETHSTDHGQIGATVVVDHGEGRETYTIVGSAEASPREGRISNESPVGRALLGRRKGDEVLVQTPAGDFSYKIVSIK